MGTTESQLRLFVKDDPSCSLYRGSFPWTTSSPWPCCLLRPLSSRAARPEPSSPSWCPSWPPFRESFEKIKIELHKSFPRSDKCEVSLLRFTPKQSSFDWFSKDLWSKVTKPNVYEVYNELLPVCKSFINSFKWPNNQIYWFRKVIEDIRGRFFNA